MSQLPEEIRSWQFSKDALGAIERRQNRLDELRKIHADGEQMSCLTADPNWEKYGRLIETAKTGYESVAKIMEARLLNQFLEPGEYGKIKMKHAEYKGAAKALTFALTVAKTLIEQGEIAAAEFATMDQK